MFGVCVCVCVCVCVFVLRHAEKMWKNPCVDSKTPSKTPPCVPAPRVHVFQHVHVVSVHTGTF